MAEAPRKATAWDVAEQAGVSQSTVSRVFTGSNRISQATRDRVMNAARMLDYLPDKRASRLRSGQTGVIAVVVITRTQENPSEVNPFAYALLGSVCRAASQRGFETLVSFQAQNDEFYGRYIEQRDADALIVLGTTQNPVAWQYFRTYLEGDQPAICWGLPFHDVPSVRSDNMLGGRMAADHLWEAGYRKPAFLGPMETDQRQFDERFAGFAERFAELGGTPIVVRDLTSDDRFEQGREAISQLNNQGEDFDAVFAACDSIALGALDALVGSGRKVPEDTGVIGFDGIAATRHSYPPLTTIRPDLEKAGQLLVSQVLEAAGISSDENIMAPVELIARASTRKPTKG